MDLLLSNKIVPVHSWCVGHMPRFNERKVLILFTVVYIKYKGSLQTEEYYHFYVLGVAKENIASLSYHDILSL